MSWQTALQNTKVELELLTEIDMLLMAEKGLEDNISLYK